MPIMSTKEYSMEYSKCSLKFFIHFCECINTGSLLSWVLPENKLGNKCKSGIGNHLSGD